MGKEYEKFEDTKNRIAEVINGYRIEIEWSYNTDNLWDRLHHLRRFLGKELTFLEMYNKELDKGKGPIKGKDIKLEGIDEKITGPGPITWDVDNFGVVVIAREKE